MIPRIELSLDFAYADALVRRPDMWPHVSLPGQDPADFSLSALPGFMLRVFFGDEPAGLFFLGATERPEAAEVHTLLTVTGARALAAGRKAIAWVFEHTGIRELASYCLDTNPRALVYAMLAGFKVFSRSAGLTRVRLVKGEK